ncbi:MAG: BLUF domain-containing protein [Phycisphaerae bacterium]|nr:BLUF domain-containing protein [Phycisphaerae bacterium]
MSPLYHLIYANSATVPFNAAALLTLLEKARINNKALGITGMLLYTDRCFFQVLEGEQGQLHRLFEIIDRDPRHGDVVTIIDEPISERSFSEWSMGLTLLSRDELSRIPGASALMLGGSTFDELREGRAKKLISTFLAGRWRANAA